MRNKSYTFGYYPRQKQANDYSQYIGNLWELQGMLDIKTLHYYNKICFDANYNYLLQTL